MPLPSRNSALDRIEQQVKSDKLWDLTHISTLMCGMAVIFTSFCVYLISDFVNCDGNSPYGQASFSALYTFALCAHLWIYSNILHSVVRDFEAPRYLSPQGRQRRRLRIPVLLAIVASGQVLAATAFGLSAYRTFMAPLGLLALVPIVATAAAISCFAAGMANTLLALSVHRSGKSTDGSLDFADKKDTKNHHPTEDPISIYDIDFTNLPTFDKQWLAVHILAIGAIISAAATSSAFLWHMPCSDSSRKDLFKLSEECFNMPFLLANMGRFVLLLWLPRVGRRVEDRNQSRIMVLLTQALFFIVAVILGITTYQAPSSNYILVIVKSQTAVASIACFLCGVYDVALMFKTNFDYTAREATNVEEGGGAYQSGGKGDEKQRPF